MAQGRADGRPRERLPLRGRVGLAVAKRLLGSSDEADCIRGIERLGATGTPEAIDALLEALQGGAPCARGPRARLTAVRVLAGEVKRDAVRLFLADQLMASEQRDVAALGGVIRATAALALARGGEKRELAILVSAVASGAPSDPRAGRGHPPMEAAARALRVARPASLEAFLDGRKRLTPQLASLLGELGDLRAVPRLRALLDEPDERGKVAAAVALARLGDQAALPVAREWLKRVDPGLRLAAAEVLVALESPEATGAVKTLLESDRRLDGLRLALASPAPGLAAALAANLEAFPEDERGRVIVALGRAGGARAAQELVALAAKPATATQAAFALATMPGDEARAALEQALAAPSSIASSPGSPAKRRLWLRAGVVRALVFREAPRGLEDGLLALLGGKAPEDRAVAVFGLVATGARTVESVLGECPGSSAIAPVAAGLGGDVRGPREERGAPVARACDAAVIGAAARGALTRGSGSLDAFTDLLARAGVQPTASEIAAGVALLAHPDGGDLSTAVLLGWAEAGGPLAPLAARALPSRDDDALRGRLRRLLEGSDPVVRAHLALGLARDPQPDAVSLLASAYRFEEDAAVRRATVRALSRRTEVQRLAPLTLARDLDPDDEVRALARSALSPHPALEPGERAANGGLDPHRLVAWITLRSNDEGASRSGSPPPPMAARLVRTDGLAIPVVADPDGVLLVPGLAPGASSLLLAPPPAPGDAPTR